MKTARIAGKLAISTGVVIILSILFAIPLFSDYHTPLVTATDRKARAQLAFNQLEMSHKSPDPNFANPDYKKS